MELLHSLLVLLPPDWIAYLTAGLGVLGTALGAFAQFSGFASMFSYAYKAALAKFVGAQSTADAGPKLWLWKSASLLDALATNTRKAADSKELATFLERIGELERKLLQKDLRNDALRGENRQLIDNVEKLESALRVLGGLPDNDNSPSGSSTGGAA